MGLKGLASVVVMLLAVSNLPHSFSQVLEACKNYSYPPANSVPIETFTVDLDEPASSRWTELASKKKAEIQKLIEHIRDILPVWVLKPAELILPLKLDSLPAPYNQEIMSIAKAAEVRVADVMIFNIFYEIFTVCTSIVAADPSGKMYHARNMDFGLFLGRTNGSKNWVVPELLRPLTIHVKWMKGNTILFESIQFAGYTGVFTAIKPKTFTFTLNERFDFLDGGYKGLLKWLMSKSVGNWVGFLSREVLENAQSYQEAVDMLKNAELIAPVYFILGGTKPNEGTVITRATDHLVDEWKLDIESGTWYLLQTNYDRTGAAPFFDDRITPGNLCMKKMTREKLGYPGLFNVLSTQPVLNQLTVYTALMQVDKGDLTAFIQNCPLPCAPW